MQLREDGSNGLVLALLVFVFLTGGTPLTSGEARIHSVDSTLAHRPPPPATTTHCARSHTAATPESSLPPKEREGEREQRDAEQ